MSTVLAKTEDAIQVTVSDESKAAKEAYVPEDGAHLDIPISGSTVAQEKRLPFWRKPRYALDNIATQPSVFDDPVTLEVYRPPAAWENTHRFDPSARWTWREEFRVVRKIDVRIMIWAFIMFFSLDLDRSNVSQANTDNFLDDLELTTDDFNLGNTLFKLCFLIAELPSQLVSKRVGPDVWVPSQMVLWSFVSLSQFWLKNRVSFLATRCLLGFMQGGFIPDMVLYLSYFYTKSELPLRLAWFWASNYVAEIVSALTASAILRLRGVGGQAGWRYLFLLEGCLTLLIGIISFFMMPPSPTQTKTWFRPKGWFTEREEVIMVNRVLRDDPSKSDMHNREGLTVKMVFKVFLDWLPVQPPQTYLTLILRQLGFSTTQTNLLSVPSKVIGLFTLLIFCYLSEIIDSRVGATVLLQVWALPLLITLYTFTEQTSPWVYFVVVTLITGFPYVHPVQVAWASTNSYSVSTRTVSASIYNMCYQADGMISANIYREDDKPLYKRGNRALIIICAANIVIYILTYAFYKGINRRRDRIWNSWTAKEQQEYLDTTKDEGNSKMNFRFVY
ncbi:MFS general substrate transporter [Lentinus tigrinus ALCF2SS1-6]|uniref:MFS general substrate transporter n=1 Tax=Lentinus tigrinus ALCF2SS1-6 TaxID=1328759 RepID=A0A5C2S1C0_9APHY|nr:MFS general substrate transporter [Lentinus tigrinus ALCF2SS1-6]